MFHVGAMSALCMTSVLWNLFLQICTVPVLTPVTTIISFTENTITHMNTNATDRSVAFVFILVMVFPVKLMIVITGVRPRTVQICKNRFHSTDVMCTADIPPT